MFQEVEWKKNWVNYIDIYKIFSNYIYISFYSFNGLINISIMTFCFFFEKKTYMYNIYIYIYIYIYVYRERE